MKFNKIGYLTKEGFKSIFTHGFMSFASVTIMVACLVIMGSFTLLAVNINALIDLFEQDNQIVAFVDENLTDDQALAISASIAAMDNVREYEFVTRDEAMSEFVEQYEDDSLFDDIDPGVFRHRYVIYLDDISLMQRTRNELYDISGIAQVNAYLEIAEGFVTVRNIVSAISMILIVILVIVSVFIMTNTVKLTTFGRREEIAIMKMVGAGNGFIRFPFVVEGVILGLVGAGIAFLIEWGIYSIVSGRVMESIAGNIISVIPFDEVKYPLLIIYAAVGIAVGAFGGNIAIRNYIKV